MIGREFDINLLCRLDSASSEDSLLEAIEEAVSARLIEELSQGQDRYQFSHALFQQTFSDEVTSSRKVRLHANIAQALQEMYDTGAEDTNTASPCFRPSSTPPR